MDIDLLQVIIEEFRDEYKDAKGYAPNEQEIKMFIENWTQTQAEIYHEYLYC